MSNAATISPAAISPWIAHKLRIFVKIRIAVCARLYASRNYLDPYLQAMDLGRYLTSTAKVSATTMCVVISAALGTSFSYWPFLGVVIGILPWIVFAWLLAEFCTLRRDQLSDIICHFETPSEFLQLLVATAYSKFVESLVSAPMVGASVVSATLWTLIAIVALYCRDGRLIRLFLFSVLVQVYLTVAQMSVLPQAFGLLQIVVVLLPAIPASLVLLKGDYPYSTGVLPR